VGSERGNEHPTAEQARFLAACKGLDGGTSLRRPIRTESGVEIGALRAISAARADDDDLVATLTQWRAANAGQFLSRFEPTPERTRRWLKDVVLADPSRIMFTVHEETGLLVGQYGLCAITPELAEIDQGIRGRSGGHSKLFYYTELTVIDLSFRQLGLRTVRARVLADNFLARKLHRSVGFAERGRQVLQEVAGKDAGETIYVPAVAPADRTGPELITFGIEKAEFYGRFGWIGHADPM
jgi:RimJ/RimL family protein N-acetyltransferase